MPRKVRATPPKPATNLPQYTQTTTLDAQFRKGRKGNRDDQGQKSYGAKCDPATINNPLFTEYYQAQGVMPAEQWDTFIACMRTPLPITFRINGTGRYATDLRTRLETDFLAQLQTTPMEVWRCTVSYRNTTAVYPHTVVWIRMYTITISSDNTKTYKNHIRTGSLCTPSHTPSTPLHT